MSGFTKEIIAKTFTEILDEKPMSKVTVRDIVERCGVNRNTFYYHFRDIPDVVEFVLKRKWDEIQEAPQEKNSILECMEEMASLVRDNIIHINQKGVPLHRFIYIQHQLTVISDQRRHFLHSFQIGKTNYRKACNPL